MPRISTSSFAATGHATVVVSDTLTRRFYHFSTDSFTLIRRRDNQGMACDEWIAHIGRIDPASAVMKTSPDPVVEVLPKYCAAMGDAATAYCEKFREGELPSEQFRWHEVFDLMLAARKGEDEG